MKNTSRTRGDWGIAEFVVVGYRRRRVERKPQASAMVAVLGVGMNSTVRSALPNPELVCGTPLAPMTMLSS